MNQKRTDDGKWLARDLIVPYLPALSASAFTEDDIAMIDGRTNPDILPVGRRSQVDLIWRGEGWPDAEDIMDGIHFVRRHYGRQVDDINILARFPKTGDTFMGVRIA